MKTTDLAAFVIMRIDGKVAYLSHGTSIYKHTMTLDQSQRWFVGDKVHLEYRDVRLVY